MLRGLPDWGSPRPEGQAQAWAAYEQEDITLLPPDALVIETDLDGRHAFHLLAVRPTVPGPGRTPYGRLDATLRLTARRATEDGRMRAAPATYGWLRLGVATLGEAAELAQPIRLDCSGTGVARLSLPLAAEGVIVIERAVADGAAPVLATVEFEMAGVAPRAAQTISVDLARLHAVLAPGLTPGELADALRDDAARAGVGTGADGHGPLDPALAEAVADHIRAQLCGGPLTPATAGGLKLKWGDETVTTGRATLDLSRPVAASRGFALTLDPFAAARALNTGGDLVTRVASDSLGAGLHDVVVDAAVALPCRGPLAIGAELSFPARPPARMHAVTESVELAEGGVTCRVRLAPNDPVAWQLAATAVWPGADGRSVERLSGAALQGSGGYALLRPADLPLVFATVEAGAALLALGEVTVTLAGTRPSASASADAILSVAAPRATLAIPNDATDATVTAVLVSSDSQSRIALPARPVGDWRIELAEVPGYGPRAIDIGVVLPPGMPLAAIEVMAEDAGPNEVPTSYAFTPDISVRTHRWLCRDPFRPGLLWRWRKQPPGSFSAPTHGQSRLDLTPETTSMAQTPVPAALGPLKAVADPHQSGVWRYQPTAVLPQRGPDGRPQVTVIDAGGMLFLTIATTLGAPAADIAATAAAIAAATGQAADKVDLRLGDVMAASARLVLTSKGGAPVELMRAQPSPSAPWQAAFAASLDGDKAVRAKAALAGGEDRIEIVYEAVTPAERAVTAKLTGRVGDGGLDAALAAGDVVLRIDADEGASDALRAEARARVLTEAETLLTRGGKTASPADLDAHVRRTEAVSHTIELVGDVGRWLTKG